MRWFRIKKADIEPVFREWFEQRGAETMRAFVPMEGFTINTGDGSIQYERPIRPHLLLWLKEQYDRAERKETWSLTMEVAITVLVAAELFMSVLLFLRK